MLRSAAIKCVLLIASFMASAIPGCADRAASPEALCGLTRGLSLAEVQRRTGSPLMHQFTAAVDGDQLCCATVDSHQPFVRFFLVFAHGGLEKVIPSDGVVEDGANPEQRMQGMLDTPELSPEELRLFVQRRRDADEQAGRFEEPGVLLLLLPLAWISQAEDAAKKSHWLQGPLRRYDAWKITLGMSASQSDAAIGPPWRVIIDEPSGVQTRVYGEFAPIERGGEPEFSWIAVVLRQDRVERVFSRAFFDPELRTQEQTRSTWGQ